jgi:hypothetical protein
MRAWRADNQEEYRAQQRAFHNSTYTRARRAANPMVPYTNQKVVAKQRGIPFLLTFEEWWEIWQTSGKWEQRGRRSDQYVMARFGDQGAYAIGNVRICTTQENNIERGKLLSDETRKRMSEAGNARWAKNGERERAAARNLGRTHSHETRERMSQAQKTRFAK